MSNKGVPEKELPMLEKTSWVKVNDSCHALVDENQKVISIIFTDYNESDGDINQIWDVEIEETTVGRYIGLFRAKLYVQETIADHDDKVHAKEKNKVVKKLKKETVVENK